jgi:[acyl-carrier-protein] S-malonyltransferase
VISNQEHRNASRRTLPDRRVTPFDWNTPVRIDGDAPVQRRKGVPRRTIPDRRSELDIGPLLGVASQALVFPGQGAQTVGMGKDLAVSFSAARQVFDEVNEAVGKDLFRIMCEGPELDLMRTENAQPCLMAYSMALLKILESEGGITLDELCRYVAGHSLGEYTALTAAGSLTLFDAAHLLSIRGKAMNAAVPLGEGGMAAIMGLDFESVRNAVQHARGGDVCVAANDNAPGQVVISGHFAAVERAIATCLGLGAGRSVMLTVSGPFHSPLMMPAADVLAEALARVSLRPPVVPLVSNHLASEVRDPSLIRELLVKNVTGTVRWRESVLHMKRNGIRTLIEVGCGRVLSGLAKRIDRALGAICIGTAQEVKAILSLLERRRGR